MTAPTTSAYGKSSHSNAVFLSFVCVLCFCVAAIQCQTLEDLRQIDGILRNKRLYDYRVPPNDSNNETVVKVYLRILNLWDLSEQSMDCKIDFYMELAWEDPRIHYASDSSFIQLPDVEIRRFWTPRIYFPNSKKSQFHRVASTNNFLEVSRTGNMFYHLRIKAKFSCLMELHRFPFDTHTCYFQIASSSDTVRLEWEGVTGIHQTSVEISDIVFLPQFTLSKWRTSECDPNFMRRGQSNDCLQVSARFHRRLGFHLINTYIPSFLIVVISWGSFWMHADAVPGRVSLGITTLLTISSKGSSVLSLTAEVSYVKAIDIWMMTCMALVFLALCEFVLANYKSRHKTKLKQMKSKNSLCEENHYDKVTATKKSIKLEKRQGWSIDKISRIIFPSIFALFNIAYWTHYLM